MYGRGIGRILLDGEEKVVVDPFAIVRIGKTALADQHDLELSRGGGAQYLPSGQFTCHAGDTFMGDAGGVGVYR